MTTKRARSAACHRIQYVPVYNEYILDHTFPPHSYSNRRYASERTLELNQPMQMDESRVWRPSLENRFNI